MLDTRAPTVPQFTRRLGIETPEHLVLELELAGLGSRMAATVCDAGLLTLAYVLLGVGIQLLPTPTGGDAEGPWSTLAAIVLILTVFLLFWGYFLLFEALNDGRTPGKRLMGIRVLMDTGHPLLHRRRRAQSRADRRHATCLHLSGGTRLRAVPRAEQTARRHRGRHRGGSRSPRESTARDPSCGQHAGAGGARSGPARAR